MPPRLPKCLAARIPLGADGDRMKRQRSALELLYAQHLVAAGITGWTTEVPFAMHLGRRWRFDFAFAGEMIAIDLNGATWVQGADAHGHGYRAHTDAEKATVAAILGWRMLTFTAPQIKTGWALLATEVALGLKPRSILGSDNVKAMAKPQARPQRFA